MSWFFLHRHFSWLSRVRFVAFDTRSLAAYDNRMRGKFITFEGGEGSGKSTQALLLQTALAAKGIDAIFTREPGGTPFAEAVRNFMLFGPARTEPGSALAEALLFYAARADHVQRKIVPALDAGTWVISVRFADSTRAYQGAAGGVPAAQLKDLERVVLGGLAPDLTFMMDLAAEAGLARAEARRLHEQSSNGATSAVAQRDLFEARDLAFHQRLREGFQEIARAEPQRCILIDALKTPELIAAEIAQTVAQRWGPL